MNWLAHPHGSRGMGSIPGSARQGIFAVQTWLSTLRTVFIRELENHVSPVSIQDVKEPPETTSTPAVTTLAVTTSVAA